MLRSYAPCALEKKTTESMTCGRKHSKRAHRPAHRRSRTGPVEAMDALVQMRLVPQGNSPAGMRQSSFNDGQRGAGYSNRSECQSNPEVDSMKRRSAIPFVPTRCVPLPQVSSQRRAPFSVCSNRGAQHKEQSEQQSHGAVYQRWGSPPHATLLSAS